MLIIGFSGGPDPAYPSADPVTDFRVIESPYTCHDSAAVLVKDGRVVAGIEQERLNRIKHTNKSASGAIRFCLESEGLDLDDVDQFAYYSTQPTVDMLVGKYMLQNPSVKPYWSARELLADMLRRDFGREIDPGKITFVEHHLAHAASAYSMSGFESSLVMTIDGQGDGLSGTVFTGEGGRLTRVADLPQSNSIGNFYTGVIGFLGYSLFDEYKVMGLAPYGDAGRYRELFRGLYTLHADGGYAVHMNKLETLMAVGRPRRKGEAFTQTHKDLAAALQESLEELVFHHLKLYRERTGHRRLCLAGGVAHNCTMNGKLLRSGLFEEVFIQPASHDAGCALGAALHAYRQARPEGVIEPLSHLYWGTDVGAEPAVEDELRRWGGFVEFRKMDDTARAAARLLSDGAVIGWVQGRSEFGPRALGNRSILADPRPPENKTLINAMVKKREGYRPFAPSVLEEYAHDFFAVEKGSRLPYMTCVVEVREEARRLLGAVTHVDGTARVQTVSRQDNRRYWEVIDAFRELTGVPILLNTSFNNDVEPIVDSVEDALACFLTTELHYLVVGDFLVKKRDITPPLFLDAKLSLPEHVQLVASRQFAPGAGLTELYHCKSTVPGKYSARISKPVHDILSRAVSGGGSLREALSEMEPDSSFDLALVIEELRELWARRVLILRPGGAGARAD